MVIILMGLLFKRVGNDNYGDIKGQYNRESIISNKRTNCLDNHIKPFHQKKKNVPKKDPLSHPLRLGNYDLTVEFSSPLSLMKDKKAAFLFQKYQKN